MQKFLSLALLLTTALAADFAQAQEGPKTSFEATYTSIGPAGPSTVRIISDGHGHTRTETTTNGSKYVSINDFNSKSCVTLIDQQKMAMKTPLKSAQDVHDAETARKCKARSIGTKVINGHPCHGWECTADGGKIEVWTGDDINYMVKSESSTAQGKVTMDLKSWSPNPTIREDHFKVPAGYRIMDVPGT